jgi:hypothetical protein
MTPVPGWVPASLMILFSTISRATFESNAGHVRETMQRVRQVSDDISTKNDVLKAVRQIARKVEANGVEVARESSTVLKAMILPTAAVVASDHHIPQDMLRK